MSDLIRKLFGKMKRPEEGQVAPRSLDQDTQPQPFPGSVDQSERLSGEASTDPPQMIVGIAQSVGKQRDRNEDTLFTLTTHLMSDSQTIPFGLYMVADGMGGHEHGEEASGVAVRAMTKHVISRLLVPMLDVPPESPADPIQQVMHDGIQAAHRAIIRHVAGGGTTLTAMLILRDQLTVAHVGDSRAYALHPDRRTQVLTRDHTLVRRLVELGQISPTEAVAHPQRNVLYRALGQGEPVDAEVFSIPVPRPGYLLLCSDGLWGVISEDQVTEIIFSSHSPGQACQDLVTAANNAGGPDNISVILLQLPG